MGRPRWRKARIAAWTIVALLVVYGGSYAILIESSNGPLLSAEHIHEDYAGLYIWMFRDPFWNEVGYYAYWPLNRAVLWMDNRSGNSDTRYAHDADTLAMCTWSRSDSED